MSELQQLDAYRARFQAVRIDADAAIRARSERFMLAKQTTLDSWIDDHSSSSDCEENEELISAISESVDEASQNALSASRQRPRRVSTSGQALDLAANLLPSPVHETV
ncbi:unnamed protein product, partial [Protopolystoma xenopodis]